jgi:cytochrome c oxidase subunit III
MANTHVKHHDYHLVDPSPWPAVGSLCGFIMAVGAIIWMRTAAGGLTIGPLTLSGPYFFLIGTLGVLFTMFGWWRDVINEAEHQGQHTPVVQLHLRYGMILFIASEVMFFVAWFWAYFDVALFPGDTVQFQRLDVTGGQWPPVVNPEGHFRGTFDPWGLPLVNTLILLTSGTTITWAHHALLHKDRGGVISGLTLTVILGVMFTALQAYEYSHATFDFAGNIYGSTFYMATGFHGFHVIVGTIFLTVILFRALAGHFTEKHHFGFEAAAWYWHFVDVVWLFLFASIYVWAAGPVGAH